MVSVDGSGEIPLNLIQGGEYMANISGLLPFGKKTRIAVVITAESGTGEKSVLETLLLLRDKPSFIRVQHVPITACKSGNDISIKAVVDSAYPLRKAILHYSYVNQFEEMHGVDLVHKDNEYSAIIPGSYIVPEWDLLYYFEFVDELGSGIIYPDFREQTPYWVINTREGK